MVKPSQNYIYSKMFASLNGTKLAKANSNHLRQYIYFFEIYQIDRIYRSLNVLVSQIMFSYKAAMDI